MTNLRPTLLTPLLATALVVAAVVPTATARASPQPVLFSTECSDSHYMPTEIIIACADPRGPTAGSSSLTGESATAALAEWIHQRFVQPAGIWTCPQAQVELGRANCLAEFQSEHRWYSLSAGAEQDGAGVVIVNPTEQSWQRRWTSYSRGVIRGFGLPGKASVNGRPAADWPFLAAGAYSLLRHRRSVRVDSFDGNSAGFGVLAVFNCHRTRRLIRCRNKLGDAMRYRPHA